MEELQVIETTSGRQFKPWASREDVQAIKQETVQAVGQAVQDPASITAIASEIASGKQAIASAINAKGGTASAAESFAELAEAVEEIPNFDDMVKLASVIAGGNYYKNALQGHDENVKYGKTEIVDILGVFEKINVEHCFQYWDLLERVDMPNLTTIGNAAFSNCSSLQEVDIPNLTTVGDAAFSGCSSLQEVDFPLLSAIGGSAFSGCSSLQEVNFPLLTSISGESNFRGCTSLKDVTIVGFTTMTRSMFSECSSLRSVKLPTVNTNTQTGYGMPFYQCYNLRNLELGTLVNFSTPFYSSQNNLRNITIGQDTNINLPFNQWTATNVIAEGGGIDELNSNLQTNLISKLYQGGGRILRLGTTLYDVTTQETRDMVTAKGWTLQRG